MAIQRMPGIRHQWSNFRLQTTQEEKSLLSPLSNHSFPLQSLTEFVPQQFTIDIRIEKRSNTQFRILSGIFNLSNQF